MCVPACLYVRHIGAGNCRNQKVQTSLNWSSGTCEPSMRVLGIELRSSERASNILNCESFLQFLLVCVCVCSFEAKSHVVQAGLEFDT